MAIYASSRVFCHQGPLKVARPKGVADPDTMDRAARLTLVQWMLAFEARQREQLGLFRFGLPGFEIARLRRPLSWGRARALAECILSWYPNGRLQRLEKADFERFFVKLLATYGPADPDAATRFEFSYTEARHKVMLSRNAQIISLFSRVDPKGLKGPIELYKEARRRLEADKDLMMTPPAVFASLPPRKDVGVIARHLANGIWRLKRSNGRAGLEEAIRAVMLETIDRLDSINENAGSGAALDSDQNNVA